MAVGFWAFSRRPPERRGAAYAAVYALSLLFFAPVFIFTNPFAAATSFAVAHGYQYLLLVGLVAGSDRIGRRRVVSLSLLILVAVGGGWLLSRASHVSASSTLGGAVFGAYLGVVMSHFVIDAGLWRLRDKFPREFLSEQLPYLLQLTAVPSDAGSPAGSEPSPSRVLKIGSAGL